MKIQLSHKSRDPSQQVKQTKRFKTAFYKILTK